MIRTVTGFVLVAVLGGLLVVGALAFAMLFTASLDALAARSAQLGVVQREAQQGALHLAAAELQLAPAPLAELTLGPWAALGLDVVVTVTPLLAPGGQRALRLSARVPPPARRAPLTMLVAVPPTVQVLRWP